MDVYQQSERSAQEGLNLTVGAVLTLMQSDLPGGLWAVTVRVMDDDTFSDDLVHTDTGFQLGAHEAGFRPFHMGIIVPRRKLRNSEPSYGHPPVEWLSRTFGAGAAL